MIFRGLALRGYGQEKHGNIFDLDEKGEAMTTPITPAECRELAKRLGVEWHHIDPPTISNPWLTCICGATFGHLDEAIRHQNRNLDFTDARVPLRLAMEREDWGEFSQYVFLRYGIEITGVTSLFIPAYYMIDQTGQLAKLLLEWLRRRE